MKKNGTTQATFRYDPLERRVEKVAGGTTYRFVYDGANWIRRTGGTTLDVIHGPGIDEPFAQDVAGMLTYYHADALGSIQKHTSAAGAVTQAIEYDAWGNSLAGTPGPYGFTGREPDPETGLMYYRARYYDPKAGRFISEDPIGFEAGPHFYEYVSNAPVNWTDPLGLVLVPAPGTASQMARKVGEFWRQFFEGSADMDRNNKAMRDRGWQGADKYYHCMANCEAAKRGPGGYYAAEWWSERREDYGWWKGDPAWDYEEDMYANRCGRSGGASGQDCRQVCAPFIPKSSPGKPPFIP